MIGYGTKYIAVAEAKKVAKRERCELTIHNKSGKISRKHSYGTDPKNIKG